MLYVTQYRKKSKFADAANQELEQIPQARQLRDEILKHPDEQLRMSVATMHYEILKRAHKKGLGPKEAAKLIEDYMVHRIGDFRGTTKS